MKNIKINWWAFEKKPKPFFSTISLNFYITFVCKKLITKHFFFVLLKFCFYKSS